MGSPEAIYDRPRTRFVAEFIGETNFLEGKITEQQGERLHFISKGGLKLIAHCPSERMMDLQKADTELAFSIRPERIALNLTSHSHNKLMAKIVDAVYHGDHLRLVARVGEETFIIKGNRQQDQINIGDEISLSFEPSDIWLVGHEKT